MTGLPDFLDQLVSRHVERRGRHDHVPCAGSAQLEIGASGNASFTTNDGTGHLWQWSGPDLWAAGSWHHLAGTFDGTTKRLYLDGVLVGTQASGPPEYDGAPVWVGADDNSGLALPLDGAADDLRLYSRRLSSAEIATLAGL